MRHLTAVQLPEGGWHYASASRRGGYPLGYCAEHEPHSTEDEARECYRKWQRDHVKMDGGVWSWGGCDVRGCDNPAPEWRRDQGRLLCARPFSVTTTTTVVPSAACVVCR